MACITLSAVSTNLPSVVESATRVFRPRAPTYEKSFSRNVCTHLKLALYRSFYLQPHVATPLTKYAKPNYLLQIRYTLNAAP